MSLNCYALLVLLCYIVIVPSPPIAFFETLSFLIP